MTVASRGSRGARPCSPADLDEQLNDPSTHGSRPRISIPGANPGLDPSWIHVGLDPRPPLRDLRGSAAPARFARARRIDHPSSPFRREYRPDASPPIGAPGAGTGRGKWVAPDFNWVPNEALSPSGTATYCLRTVRATTLLTYSTNGMIARTRLLYSA
jgi:hypothetical protein